MTRSTKPRKRVLDSRPVQSKQGRGQASMAKLTIRIPNVSWREGRPRFNPGPKLRAIGYKGEDLRHADGRWFTPQEAADWAEARAAEVAGRRQAKLETGRLPARKRARHQTIEGLIEEWFASPKFTGGVHQGKRQQDGLSPATIADYRSKLRTLAKHDPAFMQEPPPAVTPSIAQGLFDDLWQERGLHTARGIVAALSGCWRWAKSRGRGAIAFNPWLELEKPMPAPRLVTWEDYEISAFAAAADLLGRPEMADAVFLGVFTGQRQGDRLTLERAGRDDASRYVFRQSKTGAIVAIPAAPQLATRMEAAERRRFTLAVIGRPGQGESQQEADARARRLVIVDETARRPFLRDWYKHVFADIRQAAARGLIRQADGTLQLGPEKPRGHEAWTLPPCPSIAGKRDQDLRDTAVTWLGRAGCTVPEIAAITGHKMAGIHDVLRHYMATHPEMADDAINKLVTWMDKKGMAV
ncbi:hypothetical protein AncyloWKF20_05670 [Ancylobacter sp. WKF20]|uniref:hypothetical protein n=1 Tax=Ancylobacter sp. WKF20 TaxID=3039801 RepID=UPI0024342FB6|nr:hypothetical protein [Ancylobacter sp. WKF20]WGD31314.1 hypothetical protein AncyloWKF20_05670 [Ancylobacter sp. WKF20]